MQDLLDKINADERETDYNDIINDKRLSVLSRINIKDLRKFIDNKIKTMSEEEKDDALRNIYYEYAARCWAHDAHGSIPSSDINTLGSMARAIFEKD